MRKLIGLAFIFVLFLVGCTSKTFNVEYDLDGGVCDGLIYELNKDEQAILPFPIKEGHEFLGWYENGESIAVLKGDRDYHLTAMWEAYTYHITYNLNGGVCENLVTSFKFNEEVELPTPTRDGYIFSGWYENNKLIGSISNENYVLTAKWEKEVYNVKVYCDDKFLCELEVDKGTKVGELDLNHESFDKERFDYIVTESYLDETKYLEVNSDTVIEDDINLYVEIIVKPKKSYEGLKVSILGDSISTFYADSSEVNSYYGGENQFYYPIYSSTVKSYTDTWWWKTITATNMKLGINNSWSGTACYNNGNPNNSGAMNVNRISTLDDNGGVDLVLVFIGTNDCVNGNSIANFTSAYNIMLSRIHSSFPNAYIMCFALGYSAYSSYGYTDALRLQYNEIIRELAIKHHAGIIDLETVQTKDTYKDILGDSLHPSLNGMNKLSECAVAAIKDFFTNGKKLTL